MQDKMNLTNTQIRSGSFMNSAYLARSMWVSKTVTYWNASRTGYRIGYGRQITTH